MQRVDRIFLEHKTNHKTFYRFTGSIFYQHISNKQISETEAFLTMVQEADMGWVSIKSTTKTHLFAHVEDSRRIFVVSVDSEILILSRMIVTPTTDNGAPINMSPDYRNPGGLQFKSSFLVT
jgi:hypothetical protein